MRWIPILCLANSRKLGGRCVAGVRLDTGKWIRPVGATPHGELSYDQYCIDNGRPVELLDVVKVPIERAVPESNQPENWLVGNRTWKFVAKLDSQKTVRALEPALEHGPGLFGNTWDRVPAYVPQEASLALVEPHDLTWTVRWSAARTRQLRANFTLGGQMFDLSVTDPEWYEKTRTLRIGSHPRTAGGIRATDRLLFTVSLGEPYRGSCYKLVAGVIRIPAKPRLLGKGTIPKGGSRAILWKKRLRSGG